MKPLTALLPWNWIRWVDAIPPVEKTNYPLKTCVVSGDNLEPGSMGPPVDHWHAIADAGQRLVRFCCAGCIPKFERSPARYLDEIDRASARLERERAGMRITRVSRFQ